VQRFCVSKEITPVDESKLRMLDVSQAARAATEVLIADQRVLPKHGRVAVLNCFISYPRDEEPEVLPTDVYSFHANSAPVEADTFL
jgi:hypothetical protein